MKYLKHIFLVFLFFFIGLGSGLGQITINLSDYATIGDTIIRAEDTLPGAGIMVLGTGSQSWDFTSLQVDNLDSILYIDPNSTPAAADFPNSNLAYSIGPFYYETATASNVTIDGIYDMNFFGVGVPGSVIYNPTQKIVEFPSTDGSSMIDTSAYSMKFAGALVGAPVDSLGVNHISFLTSVFDAYGPMTTPTGTYQTIRQYMMEITTDSIIMKDPTFTGGVWQLVDSALLGSPNPTIDTIFLYKWWATGEDHPVAELETDAPGGNVILARYKIGGQVLAIITSFSNVICSGNCDGTATVTGLGGVLPYTYLWDDPGAQVSATVTGLCGGTFTAMVIDAASDTAYTSVSIVIPPALMGTVSSTPDSGSSTGTVLVTASGGTPPYSYYWGAPIGQTTAFVGGLIAGLYDVTVTDANGCTYLDTAEVTSVQSGCNVTSSFTAASTNLCEGESTSFTNNSSGALSYLWLEDGVSFSNATNSSRTFTTAGTFSISLVADSSSCSDTSAIVVVVNVLPSPIITAGGPITFCQGGDVTLASSVALSYLWSTSETSQSIIVSTSGSFTVAVLDTNGCGGTSSSIIVTVTPAPSIDSEVPSDASSCSANDGTIIIGASGGTPPLQYSIDGGTSFSASGGFTGLGTGSYDVVISDAVGCIVTGSMLTISAPGGPTTSAGSDGETCDGTAYTLSGMFGGSASSVTWTTSGSGTFDSATAMSPVYTPSSADALAGSIVLTITTDDPGGACVAALDAMVLTINPNPSAPTVTELGNIFSCDQTGFNYQWFLNSDTLAGETNQVFIASQTGFYQVALIDNNGCSSLSSGVGYVGITEHDSNYNIVVRPNPNFGEFVVEVISSGNGAARIRLLNILGQTVYQDELQYSHQIFSKKVEVGYLLPGVYNLEVLIGEKRNMLRLVIQ